MLRDCIIFHGVLAGVLFDGWGETGRWGKKGGSVVNGLKEYLVMSCTVIPLFLHSEAVLPTLRTMRGPYNT